MQRKLQQGKGARRGGGGGGATGTSTYYAALLSRARNVEDMILLRDINIGWLPADYFYNCSVDNEPHAPLSAESQKGESNNNKDRQGIVHDKRVEVSGKRRALVGSRGSVAFTRKPRRGASSLAEAATKPKTGLNSVAGFISKYARLIGLYQKTSRF